MYQIRHTTRYSYSEPVPVCHNLVHLAPRSSSHQVVHDFKLLVSPAPVERRRRVDYFGNQVDQFSIHEAHSGLTVTADSVVDVYEPVKPDASKTPAWNDLIASVRKLEEANARAAFGFTFPSRYVPISKVYAEYAEACFPSGRPVLEGVLDLTQKIHREFLYDPRATTVHTRLEDAFSQRAGVCQDFAHIQIACLRALGLPARYVSGYLRTIPPAGQPRLIGADASHAWVSVYCGTAGWVEIDPTNNRFTSTDHIVVALGRDYADVCPIQGVVVGGGHHLMTVSVDVASQESIS